MLREPASSPQFVPPPLTFEDDDPFPIQEDNIADSMRELLDPYMAIAHEGRINEADLQAEDQAIIVRNKSYLLMTFSGYLKQDSEEVYDALDEALKPMNRYALFRENNENPDTPHLIHIIEGRLETAHVERAWLNILLFILTIFSVLWTGTTIAIGQISLNDPVLASELGSSIGSILNELWRGYPYALSLLAILVAHEMGHYLVMRYYGINASLPYFIPAWLISPFGTFGAAIVLRDVLKNRKILLDVGAAGPIAGFIVAVPIVIYGLSTSPIIPLDGGQIEGNSLIYAFAKFIALGQFYPTAEADVLINQLAFAGWTGLFVTALNLIPLGQLDGGHVMYSLFGDRARLVFYPVMLILAGFSVITGQTTWLFFLLLLMFMGRFYAVPMDTITPLDTQRRIVAIIALIIFVLTFIPRPFYSLGSGDISDVAMLPYYGMMVVAMMLTIPRWFNMGRR